MAWFWQTKAGEGATVSADFRHALTQQVLRTELIRIKALIGVTVLLGSLILVIHTIDPYAIEHLWHGRLNPADLFRILIPFVLFELWVHAVIQRHLGKDQDLPVYRRYIGVLVETSMPTFALAMHIDSMGPVEALGFAVPLTYFIFIILSTLRLDFWLSTFTGFVAAVELFGMAMFYHRAGSADPSPKNLFTMPPWRSRMSTSTAKARSSRSTTSCGERVRAPAVKLRKSTNMTATRRISLLVLAPSAIRRSTTCGETCWPNKLVIRSRAVAARMLASNCRRN